MKLILNVLKALAVIYWVLAVSLFVSLLFIPQALDTGYDAYLQFVDENQTSEVVSSSEESTESLTKEESSVVEEEVVTSEESSEESSETETTSTDGEAAEVETSSEEPITSEEETSEEVTEPSEDDEVICLALECEEEPISEELAVLTKEEFKDILESSLLYSAIVMLPLTLVIFKISSAFNNNIEVVEIQPEVKEEVVQPVTESPLAKRGSKKQKPAVKQKTVEIGITGVKVPK
jgi:hypothetical protein